MRQVPFVSQSARLNSCFSSLQLPVSLPRSLCSKAKAGLVAEKARKYKGSKMGMQMG